MSTYPYASAGLADDGFRILLPITEAAPDDVTMRDAAGNLYRLNTEAMAEREQDVATYCAPSPDTCHGLDVPDTFRAYEHERFAGRSLIARGKRDVSGPDAIEADADRWLIAAGYPTDRPDRVADTVDPMTLLEYTDRSNVKPDRVAWRGRSLYRRVSAKRVDDDTATMSVRSDDDHAHRVAPDITYRPDTIVGDVRVWDDLYRSHIALGDQNGPISYRVAWQDKQTKRQAEHANKRARTVRAQANKPQMTRPSPNIAQSHLDGQMAGPGQGAESTSLTAAYGRPVTPWTAATRSLPRIMARASDEVRANVAELLDVLSTSSVGTVPVRDGLTVHVVGDYVDDGEHGQMRAAEWAKRAALAGVAVD